MLSSRQDGLKLVPSVYKTILVVLYKEVGQKAVALNLNIWRHWLVSSIRYPSSWEALTFANWFHRNPYICLYFEILLILFLPLDSHINRFHVVIYHYSLWGPFESRILKNIKKGHGLIEDWYCQLKNIAMDIFSSMKKESWNSRRSLNLFGRKRKNTASRSDPKGNEQ